MQGGPKSWGGVGSASSPTGQQCSKGTWKDINWEAEKCRDMLEYISSPFHWLGVCSSHWAYSFAGYTAG